MGMEFLKSSDKNSAQKSSWPPFVIDFALQLECIPTLNHLQSRKTYILSSTVVCILVGKGYFGLETKVII